MSFSNLNINPPEAEPIETGNLGKPPGEIELSDEEVSSFEDAKEVLSGSSIEIDSLFSLFKEWQSDKTKSIKRFVLSITFVLGLTLPAGIDITEVKLFGIEVPQGMGSIFLISILGVTIVSFAYYDYLRRKDREIHKAKIDSLENDLEPSLEASKTVDKIVQNNDSITAEELFKYFRDPMNPNSYAQDAYEAIKFYEGKLKSPKINQDMIEKIEFYGMYLLGVISVFAILDDFIGFF